MKGSFWCDSTKDHLTTVELDRRFHNENLENGTETLMVALLVQVYPTLISKILFEYDKENFFYLYTN